MAARTVVVILIACLALGANCRHISRGDLAIPCSGGCLGSQSKHASAQAMPAGCAESATADLPARWQLPQYSPSWKPSSFIDRKWGPDLNLYQSVSASQVPSNCNPVSWAQQRLLRVVTDTIALQLNYCHHHAPAYETPPAVQTKCDRTEPGESTGSCVCSAAGMNKANPWRGLDCSNFAAFAYNLAFGFYPTSNIGQMACHPTLAPGRLLPITTSKLNQLRPGDLVFITLGRKGHSPPVRVSHVVFWTGWSVGSSAATMKAALLANVPDYQKPGVEKCMQEKEAAGEPVYVIADSHNNGPELRPFCGWYMTSFSHARRIIEPSSSLPVNDNSVAYWDDSSLTCQSKWALQG